MKKNTSGRKRRMALMLSAIMLATMIPGNAWAAETEIAETEITETELAETEVAETEITETELAETELAEETYAETVDTEILYVFESETADAVQVVESETAETEAVEPETVETEMALLFAEEETPTAESETDAETSDPELEVPRISSINVGNNGVELSWETVPGAAQYRVFRKTDDSEWAEIGDTAAADYVDKTASDGVTYYYTVQCLDSAGNAVSDYDTEGRSIFYADKPVINSVSNGAAGVKLTWGQLTGVSQYCVYRKSGTGSWTKIAETAAGTYTDKTAVSGTKYTYTIQCLDSAGQTISGFDTTGKSITYVAAPTLKSASNVYGGVTVTWGKVTGAAKYRVYRKSGTGNYAKVGDTTAVSLTDKNVTSGTTYTYMVRCLDSAGTIVSGYDTAGKTVTYVAPPTVSSVSNVVGGVKVAWGKVAGAAKYRVFRKTGSGSWTKLADTTAVNYTDKTAVSGTKYAYTVRCLNSAGSYVSAYNTTGKTITYVAAPTISSVTNVVGGVKVTWGKVNGAAKYRIFRKTGSGSWTKLADTTAVTYTDKTAVSGTKYTYTVRCLNSAGSYVSAYNTTGKAVTYVAAPAISSVNNVVGGVKIAWGKVKGAAKYRVFRKTGSGSWTKLADTTAVSYTDKKAVSGTKYAYTVRCLNSAGSYVSAYNTTGKSITYVAAPVVSSIKNTVYGAKLFWGKVKGASKYRVYRKTASGSWTKLADTTSTNYLDKTGKNGTKYFYSVRCLNASGSVISAFDSTGKSITYRKLIMDVNTTSVSMTFTAESSAVMITYLGSGYVEYNIEDQDIVDKCTWGNWNGRQIPLIIYPARKEGTTYITLSNSDSGETIRIKVTVTSPIKVSKPAVPKTISNYRYDDSVEQRSIINYIGLTIEKQAFEGFKINVTLEGEKTYDYRGAFQSSYIKIGYKLYDSSDYVVESGTCYTDSVAEGERFKKSFTIWLDSDSEEDYRLELLNVN